MERERQLQEIHRQLSDICTKAKLENTINIYSPLNETLSF